VARLGRGFCQKQWNRHEDGRSPNDKREEIMNLRKFVLPAAVTAIAALGLTGAARAADPVPLKIGFLEGYSGPFAIFGQETDAAIKAYMSEHGDVVAGRKIVLLKRDTTGPNPDVVHRLVQELITRDKVELIAGMDYTPNALAAAGPSTQAKMPVLIVNAATTRILDHAPYEVRFGFTTSQVAVPYGRWAVAHGYKRVFAIYTDYGPGIEAGASFKKSFAEAGGTLVGEVKPPLRSPDYSAYVQRAKDANPQAIFIFAPAGEHPQAFLKAYKDSGLKEAGVKILATGDLTDELQFDALGDATLGMYTVFHYSEDHNSALNHMFVKDFYKFAPAHVRPDFGGAVTYDVLEAIYRLVKAQNGKIDPDKTIAMLKGMHFESPRGPIMIDQNRDIVQNVYVREVRKIDGKLQNVEIDTIPMVDDHGNQVKMN
jgi:branched-chain amino acid transport system substrate-binding protein